MYHFLLNTKASRKWLVLLGDEQADLPLVHELGPALDCGRADVGDDLREGRVLLRGQHDQHGGRVAVIWQLHHLVLQALGRTGMAWGGRTPLRTNSSFNVVAITLFSPPKMEISTFIYFRNKDEFAH